jgi:alpha-beta hydrolase superfamily lysophospholipase
VLLIPLLAYVFLSPLVAWPLYNTIVFRPSKTTRDVDAYLKIVETHFLAKKRDIVFPSANGKLLHAWFFELPNTRRVFLFSHGRGGSIGKKLNVTCELLRCGGSVFQYDYQGYGDSQGSPSIEGVCDDTVAAYDYLIEHEHRKSANIIAYGESFGTGVSGQLVTRRKVGGVILHSGYSSLLRAGRDWLPWLRLYPDSWFPHQVLDNVAVFSKPHPPLLIVHGTRDQLLTYRNAEDLYQKAVEPKMMLMIPQGPHICFGPKGEFFTAVSEFLRRYNL